jgi:hypothetical protein
MFEIVALDEIWTDEDLHESLMVVARNQLPLVNAEFLDHERLLSG